MRELRRSLPVAFEVVVAPAGDEIPCMHVGEHARLLDGWIHVCWCCADRLKLRHTVRCQPARQASHNIVAEVVVS
jgi:hypothetical protein